MVVAGGGVDSPENGRPLADHKDREEVVGCLDRNFVVVAGAGTGKTQLITDRLVEALLAGELEPKDVVAITFTDAAAAEMRERLRIAITERVASANPSPGTAADRAGTSAPKKRAQKVLEHFEEAKISTIHAFARSILMDYPLAAGLPVSFDILDETAHFLELKTGWLSFLDEASAQPGIGEILAIGLALGIGNFHLQAFIESLQQAWAEWEVYRILGVAEAPSLPDDRTEALQLMCGGREPEAVASDIREALRQLTGPGGSTDIGGGADLDDGTAYIARRLSQVADLLENFRDPTDAFELARLVRLVPNRKAVPKKAALGASRKRSDETSAGNEDPSVWSLIESCLGRLSADLASAYAQTLVALGIEFLDGERKHRIRQGGLTFDDLVALAARLLVERPEIAAALRNRYRFVVVDEFQDTDWLQVVLIFRLLGLDASPVVTRDSTVQGNDASHCTCEPERLLGGEAGGGATSGRIDERPPDGSLVVVGDPKQSIYGFRGAKPEVLGRLVSMWPDSVRSLRSNFRSVKAILDFVNEVFARCFSALDFFGSARYERLEPGRADALEVSAGGSAGAKPRVVVLGDLIDGSASEVRSLQFRHFGKCIKDLVEVHGLHRYGDIAILLRTRTGLRELEAVFEELEIPYTLETGSLLYATEEARSIEALLRAVAHPGEPASVVAALKSLFFSLSDQDLAEYASCHGRPPWRWSYWKVAEVAKKVRAGGGATEGDLNGNETAEGSHDDSSGVGEQDRHRTATPPNAGLAVGSVEGNADEALYFDWAECQLPGCKRVITALLRLADLAELSKSLAVPDFLDFAMRSQMVYEGSVLENLGSDRQSERIRRFGILLDSCRSFASQGARTPDEYQRWFEQQREGGAFHSELPVVDPNAESVKVLTVHGAKGLEFPVVFVASFETQSRSDAATALVGKGGLGIEAKIGAKDAGVKTPGYDDAKERAAREEFAESMRLAYVAFTRARERLYVSLYGKNSNRRKDSNNKRKEVAPRQSGDLAGRLEASALPKDPYDLVRNAIEELFGHELFDEGVWAREPALEPKDAVEDGLGADRRQVALANVHSSITTPAITYEAPPPIEGQPRPIVWDKTCADSMKRRLVLQSFSAEESGLAASIPVFSATDVAMALAPYSFNAEGRDEAPLEPGPDPAFSDSVVPEAYAPSSAKKTRRSDRRVSNADALRIGNEVHEALASLDLSVLGAAGGGMSGVPAASSAGDQPLNSKNSAPGSAGIRAAGQGTASTSVYDWTEGPEAALAALKPDLAPYAFELVYKAIKSPVVALAGQSRHWKELYVCARSPQGAAVEGYCDLVIETQGGLIVVDYKTDALSSALDKDRLLEHYSMQLAAYAYALARATGLKVLEARILFLGDEALVEKEVDKLEERMQQIEDWLDALALRREAVAEAIRSSETRLGRDTSRESGS